MTQETRTGIGGREVPPDDARPLGGNVERPAQLRRCLGCRATIRPGPCHLCGTDAGYTPRLTGSPTHRDGTLTTVENQDQPTEPAQDNTQAHTQAKPRGKNTKTVLRQVRVAPELWQEAAAVARTEDRSLNEVISEFLRSYVGR